MNTKEIIRIIREVAIVIILILVGYKIISTDFTIDVGTLSVTDIVALLLAFFAVGLSAAFYFKGSEASNLFYDNMHKFTQDTSVILGKIESKFSEQLRNIEQRSADLKVSVDKYYSSDRSEEINNKREETEKQVSKSKQQYDELIENVFSKVQADADDKAKLKSELQNKENELRNLQTTLSELELSKIEKLKPRLKRYLARRLVRVLEDEESHELSPNDLFLKLIKTSIPPARRELKEAGFISSLSPKSENDITESGLEFLMGVLDTVLTESNEE